MLAKEIALWVLRRRRRWRVRGASMEPEFADGDLVLLDETARVAVGDVIVARHPFKNIDVIKYVQAIDDTRLTLESPAGDDSRQFGRVPIHTVRGRVTVNLTSRQGRVI